VRNWKETELVFEEALRLKAQGRQAALGMIVDLEGSAYRLPGAKLLVRDDGTMIGNVSGGCLENDVREVALRVLKKGGGERVQYDTSGSEDLIWGMGVGCDGKVDLLITPVTMDLNTDAVEFIRDAEKGDEPFAIAVVVEGSELNGRLLAMKRSGARVGSTGKPDLDDDVFKAAHSALEGGGSEMRVLEGTRIFVEVLQPPPRLIVCGASDDARPLVRLADEAGFRVMVVDHRRAYVTKERFPEAVQLAVGRADDGVVRISSGQEALAVVKLHILAEDKAWVEFFSEKDVPYIGLLGSRSRREQVTERLDDEHKARVYGPVGLDIGAEGPEQIAVSVVAELMAVRAGRHPDHLRNRKKGVHESS